MYGTVNYLLSSTFTHLKVEIREEQDRNLKNTLEFVMTSLGAVDDDSLDSFFSPERWGATRADLRLAATKRWPNSSTRRAELSRITKISKLAADVMERNARSPDGTDLEYAHALSILRAKMKKKKVKNLGSLEKQIYGEHNNCLGHLFSKKRKYHPNRSKKIVERLEILCDFLEVSWDDIRYKLIDPVNIRQVSNRLKPSAFPYYLKEIYWPKDLRVAVDEIVRFHMGITPGQLPDGTSKLRTDKSYWKVRESDNVSASRRNLYSILGSFFGYCTLPSDSNLATDSVRKRLENTSVKWKEADVPMYVSWMTGERIDRKDVSISMLFDLPLIERWLNWLADRNGGISGAQPKIALMLCALTNSQTGAIAQSYEIATQVLGYPTLPNRVLDSTEKIELTLRMKEWADYCGSASIQFRLFHKSFSSSKVKKKRNVIVRHEKILSLEDPLEAVQKLLIRLHKSEPRHLEKTSQSWLVWARNMTLLELMVSNPLRAENLSTLKFQADGSGSLRKTEAGYEIYLEKHEVKNPHEEKHYGYRGDVSHSASEWLDFYIDFVRPLWSTEIPQSERLFLTDSGREICVKELRTMFVRISRLHLPEYSELNPHIFRHIVATSWLKNHPDDFITVSLILGDRLETVMREYAHLASSDGLLRYHKALEVWGHRKPPAMGGS